MRRKQTLLMLLGLLFTSQIWAAEFNTDGDTEGWKGVRAGVEVKDGVLTASVVGDASGNDPWIEAPYGPYDANEVGGCYMKVRWSVPNASRFGSTRFYWFPASGGHNSVAYAAPDDPNQFSLVYIDLLNRDALENDNYWEGVINNFRIDLADGPSVGEDYTVDFDWIRMESQYIDNESFEYAGVGDNTFWGWEGPADQENFAFENTNVKSRNYALKVTGKGAYQHIAQNIKGGTELEKGSRINLTGALLIPAASWNEGSSIWFRIREFTNDGQENLSAPIAVTTFDDWFEFSAELTLIHEPADRAAVDVQLFSLTPDGTVFYADDIFVEVLEPPAPDEDKHWKWHKSSWEFNTDGDLEGWGLNQFADPPAIASGEVGNGVLTLTMEADREDPWIVSPAGPFYTGKSTGLVARMRVSSGTATGNYENFWFFDEGGFSNVFFDVPLVGEWFVLYTDLSEDAAWNGWINNIRYDVGDFYQEEATVEFDWIRFVDEYVNNNGFEGSLEPWFHEGAGDLSTFSLSSEQVFSGETSLKIEGVGGFHALTQRVEGWDQIPVGATVSVKGYYYVPSETWDPNGIVWFRVNEYDGSSPPVENYSPWLTEPVLDAWTAFEYSITTIYEPEDRVHMSCQLFSNCVPGTIVYADDVFVSVEAQEPQPGWPVNCVKLAEDQEITTDGVVTPEEYAGAQALIINNDTLTANDPYLPYVHNAQTANNDGPSLEDFSVTYYFMWDDEFLYVGAVAQDDINTRFGDTPNHMDCMQFVLAETPQEESLNKIYIPTIAPADADGKLLAKTDFDGFILYPVAEESEKAGGVDPDTQDWTVEVKIPWVLMIGDFSGDILQGDADGDGENVFPPSVGDVVGFAAFGIDVDSSAGYSFFACTHEFMPWEGVGLGELRFVGPVE